MHPAVAGHLGVERGRQRAALTYRHRVSGRAGQHLHAGADPLDEALAELQGVMDKDSALGPFDDDMMEDGEPAAAAAAAPAAETMQVTLTATGASCSTCV